MPPKWAGLLRSESSTDRLRGVRLLANEGGPAELGYLAELRRDETDSWVQRAMDHLISTWQGQRFVEDLLEREIGPEIVEAKAGEIQTLTRRFVHEVAHLCGRIEARAMSDIGVAEYSTSKTRQAVSRLQDFLAVVRELHEAAEPASLAEFNLSDCVRNAAALCDPEKDEIIFARDDSVTVTGDERHLRIALANVVRNALDESRELGNAVTLSWDKTDRGYWISVIDGGKGLPLGFSHFFEPNVTSKSTEHHFGWGLTIAKQALDVLGASIRYAPGATGGAVCYISYEEEPNRG